MSGWPSLNGVQSSQETALVPYAEPAPPPLPKERRIRLGNINQIRAELAAVYREARLGKLDTAVATRYTYMLRELAVLIRDHDIEKRLEAIEKGNPK